MPELIEVEYYRRALEPFVGGRVQAIEMPDTNFTRPKGTPIAPFGQLIGEVLVSTSRRGKLLVLHFGDNADDEETVTLGMRFGMTGRLLVNGSGPIDKLEYASGRNEPTWDRFTLVIDGHRLSIRDQRRLGSVELNPNLHQLGPEASTVDATQLQRALAGRTKAMKSVLLDQSLLAGLGNLLVDESLWVAGIDPRRSAASFSDGEIESLATAIVKTVAKLTNRGGSHTGDSFASRNVDVPCPRDGQSMQHDTVGGRSTWWCPAHQQ